MVISVGYFEAILGPWFADYTLVWAGTSNPALIFLIGAVIVFLAALYITISLLVSLAFTLS
jgi:hypothetical protein